MLNFILFLYSRHVEPGQIDVESSILLSNMLHILLLWWQDFPEAQILGSTTIRTTPPDNWEEVDNDDYCRGVRNEIEKIHDLLSH